MCGKDNTQDVSYSSLSLQGIMLAFECGFLRGCHSGGQAQGGSGSQAAFAGYDRVVG
jgi:hypothetical protein